MGGEFKALMVILSFLIAILSISEGHGFLAWVVKWYQIGIYLSYSDQFSTAHLET